MTTISEEQINILIELGEIDSQLKLLGEFLGNVDGQINELFAKQDAFKGTFEEQDQALSEKQSKYRELELNVQTNEATLEKRKEQLRLVNNNKEYQLMQREIDDIKKLNSGIEDEMIQLLEMIEAEGQIVEEKRGQLLQLESQIASQVEDIKKENKAQRKEFTELKEKRAHIAERVSPFILRRYDKALERTGGPGIAQAQNGACLGCFMNIPPQLFIQLQRGEATYCPLCQRILYWSQPTENEET